MICHKYKFIFIHIPKCAGTSIETAHGAWNVNLNKSDKFKKFCVTGNSQHWDLETIHKHFPETKHYNVFTFIRNPWDRAVSIFKYLIKNKPNIGLKVTKSSFLYFCENIEKYLKHTFESHERTMCDYIIRDGINIINTIGRTEQLQEDYKIICEKFNIKPHVIPRINVSDTSDIFSYTKFYDTRSKDIIRNVYREDIERFGYKFI